VLADEPNASDHRGGSAGEGPSSRRIAFGVRPAAPEHVQRPLNLKTGRPLLLLKQYYQRALGWPLLCAAGCSPVSPSAALVLDCQTARKGDAGSASNRLFHADPQLGSGTISTGSMATLPMLAASAGGSSAAISCRHLKTWLAFTSCRRATMETDAPGSSVSATIRRFNASGHSRRFGLLELRLVSINAEVDTSFNVATMPHHRANRPSAAAVPHRALTAGRPWRRLLPATGCTPR
jgi:hypothetical protein